VEIVQNASKNSEDLTSSPQFDLAHLYNSHNLRCSTPTTISGIQKPLLNSAWLPKVQCTSIEE
jgi:hypothetical protein